MLKKRCFLRRKKLQEGFMILSGTLLQCVSREEEITIPDGVTDINNYAFRHCRCVREVTIPTSVTCIGPCAFLDCKSLKTVRYLGTEAQRRAIRRGRDFYAFFDPEWVCEGEKDPTDTVETDTAQTDAV